MRKLFVKSFSKCLRIDARLRLAKLRRRLYRVFVRTSSVVLENEQVHVLDYHLTVES